jgi:hypothetical protein
MRFLPLLRAALHEARDRGDASAQRRIIVGIEGWSTWREQPEVWAWVSELASSEPADDADAEVLRMGAISAWRLGRMDLFRNLSKRCVEADPGGPTGEQGMAARILLAHVDERWVDVCELIRDAPRTDRAEQGIVWSTLEVRALIQLGKPRAALDLSRRACRDAEELGAPSIRALALLAAARTWHAAEPTGGVEHAEVLLVQARRLADSVGSAELVAHRIRSAAGSSWPADGPARRHHPCAPRACTGSSPATRGSWARPSPGWRRRCARPDGRIWPSRFS